jgi:3-hydroxyisobutyryl-CoA hydrolase
VLFESNGSVRSYILNRPLKLNALDMTMLGLLKPKIQVRYIASGSISHTKKKHSKEWNQSSLCGLVVGRGSGRAFCAGGDIAGTCYSPPESSPLTNPRTGVIDNAAKEETRQKAIEFFKSE